MSHRSKLAILAFLCVSVVLSVVPVPAHAADSIEKVPVYRFYHRKASSHFFTTSSSERARVINEMSSTYRYEGAKFYGWKTGGTARTAVARFFNKKTKTHFYTISSSEISRLKQSSHFRYEGTVYYGQNNYTDNDEQGDDWLGQCSLYRFYNFTNGTHFYTANAFEASNVINELDDTYRFEGVGYIVWTSRWDQCLENME